MMRILAFLTTSQSTVQKIVTLKTETAFANQDTKKLEPNASSSADQIAISMVSNASVTQDSEKTIKTDVSLKKTTRVLPLAREEEIHAFASEGSGRSREESAVSVRKEPFSSTDNVCTLAESTNNSTELAENASASKDSPSSLTDAQTVLPTSLFVLDIVSLVQSTPYTTKIQTLATVLLVSRSSPTSALTLAGIINNSTK